MVRLILIRHRFVLALCAAMIFFFASRWIIDGAWFTADMITFTSAVENLYGRAQRAGEFAVWAPEIQGGYPIFANGQMHFFYPPHLLLRTAFSGPVLLNVSLLFHALLAVVGMYALLRTQALSRVAAGIGALLFVFGGAFSARFALTNFILPLSWTPLILFLFHQWWHRRSRFAFIGWVGASACQILAGHPHAVLIGMVVEALWMIVCVVRGGITRRHMLEFLIGGALIVGLTLPEILPTLSITRETDRAQGLPTEELLEFSIPPAAYIGLVHPHPFGHGETYRGPKGEAEIDVYVGWGALLASIGALFFFHRRLPLIGWFALLLVAGGMLALGEHLPLYHWLIAHTPQRYFAIPARYFFLAHAGIAILAALGVDAFRQRSSRVRWLRTRDALLFIIILGPVAWHAWTWEPGVPWRNLATPPLVDTLRNLEGTKRIFAQANLGDVAPENNFGFGLWNAVRADRIVRQTFISPFDTIARVGIHVARGAIDPSTRIRLRVATQRGDMERVVDIPADHLIDSEQTFIRIPPLAGVKGTDMLLDLSLVSAVRNPPRLYIHRNPGGLDADPTGILSVCGAEECTPVTTEGHTTDLAFTVLPERTSVSWSHELLGPNVAAGYGIGSAQYTGALSLPIAAAFLKDLQERGASALSSNTRHLVDRFPITHFIGRFPPHRTLDETIPGLREVAAIERDDAFLRVYENTQALPRIHFARHIRAGGSDALEQLALLHTLETDEARETVVADIPRDMSDDAGGIIETVTETRRTVTLRTDRTTTGFLVFRDLLFPGWSVEIDGRTTPMLRTDALWRGVTVPAGIHTVVFRYRLPHESLLWSISIGSGITLVTWGLGVYTQRIHHRNT